MKEKRNIYEKLQKDVSEEIDYLVKVLKAETEWLEQHSQTKISTCTSPRDIRDLVELRDIRDLVELRDYLDRMTRGLRRQNYFLADVEGGLPYLLDGVIEEVDDAYYNDHSTY